MEKIDKIDKMDKMNIKIKEMSTRMSMMEEYIVSILRDDNKEHVKLNLNFQDKKMNNINETNNMVKDDGLLRKRTII